jgi:hypothetical protein
MPNTLKVTYSDRAWSQLMEHSDLDALLAGLQLEATPTEAPAGPKPGQPSAVGRQDID